jgi:CspA family cold shock protein
MPTGTVKMFKTDRGYGFIVPHSAGPDVFVHARQLLRCGGELAVGDRVEYELSTSERNGKVEARDVRLLTDAPAEVPATGHDALVWERGAGRDVG